VTAKEKNILDFDKVKKQYQELMKCEKIDLDKCVFMKNGKKFHIPAWIVDEFQDCGLMNQDFVMSDFLDRFYKDDGSWYEKDEYHTMIMKKSDEIRKNYSEKNK